MNEKKMLKTTAFIIFMVSCFLMQTLIIVSKKWKSMTLIDRVWSLETLIMTILVFSMSFDILLDHRYKSFIETTIRGELFGYKGGVVNSNAHNAYFRGRKYLNKIKKINLEDSGGFENFEKGEKFKELEAESKINKNINLSHRGGLKNGYLNLFSTLNYVDEYENSLKILLRGNSEEKRTIVTISAEKIGGKFPQSDKTSQFEIDDDQGGIHEHFSNGTSGNLMKFDENIMNFDGNMMEFGENLTKFDENIMSFDENNDLRLEIDGKFQRPSLKSQIIIKKLSEKCSKRIRISKVMLMFISLGINIIPLCNIIIYFVKGTQVIDLKTAFLTYFPFTKSSTPETIHQFIIVVFFEYLYVYLFYKLSLDMVTISLLGYSMTHTEIGLLINSLKEFNAYLCCGEKEYNNENQGPLIEEIVLKKFGHLVAHHTVILNMVNNMSSIVSFRVFYVNGAICMELCVSIFLLVEGDYSFKVKYFLVAFCLVIILAQLSEDGQLVENGLEDIRISFSELNWLNLPIRLHKSLLIVLTRSSKPPKIGSLGIFYINRLNLSTIIRASYSYFNILTRLNRK